MRTFSIKTAGIEIPPLFRIYFPPHKGKEVLYFRLNADLHKTVLVSERMVAMPLDAAQKGPCCVRMKLSISRLNRLTALSERESCFRGANNIILEHPSPTRAYTDHYCMVTVCSYWVKTTQSKLGKNRESTQNSGKKFS